MFARCVASAVPHFETLPSEHKKHVSHHSIHARKTEVHASQHVQQSAAIAAAHPMTPDQFLALAKQQSEAWLSLYASQVHNGELRAADVFGRNTPMKNASENPDSVLYVIDRQGK